MSKENKNIPLEAPLYWVEKVTAAVDALKEVPLWGHPPIFPFKAAQDAIEGLLGGPVKLTTGKAEPRDITNLADGLGQVPYSLALELTPLSTPFYLLVGQEDVLKLASLTLSTEKGVKGFTTPAFQEGFWRFLILQAVQAIDALRAFGDLSLKMGTPRLLPHEDAITYDVSLKIEQHTLWVRIALPLSFQQAFKAHFATALPLAEQGPLAKTIDLPIRVVVAHTMLAVSAWKKVKKGDAILLDACSFDPETNEGNVTLAVSEIPLFFARPMGEQLEIVDYALYNEETMSEDDTSSHEEAPEEEYVEEDQEEHHQSTENNSKELFDPQEVPLSLTVEVARLKIALDKLLQLKPGNVIELPVHPEQGVDISIGGKKMAKGELVRLGDALAVKILQLK
jgi:flagellar motor switch protein FliN/FliY